MANMNLKDALNKALKTTKQYIDKAIEENGFSGDYNDLENKPVSLKSYELITFSKEEIYTNFENAYNEFGQYISLHEIDMSLFDMYDEKSSHINPIMHTKTGDCPAAMLDGPPGWMYLASFDHNMSDEVYMKFEENLLKSKAGVFAANEVLIGILFHASLINVEDYTYARALTYNESKAVIAIHSDIQQSIESLGDITLTVDNIKTLDNMFLDPNLKIKNSLTMGERLSSPDIGKYSVSIGDETEASGFGAYARGYKAIARGEASTAIGNASEATAQCAFAAGYATVASNIAAHAEGHNTTASGSHSHAEGYYTTASGAQAHAEGYETTASGKYSHAEGYMTIASGMYSHTEGHTTKAYGFYSHAEGVGTIARGSYSHVQGKYNIEDTNDKYAHIVGNGNGNTSSTRSNAHTLDWNGNAWFQGNVSINGTPTNDNDLTTKKYVDNAMANATPTIITEEDINAIIAEIDN